jgi:hypothetical protein
MKSTEQLVASIRELRFAIDRLTEQEIEEAQAATRQALIAQAKALEADIDRLLEQLGEISPGDAFERDLANSY